MTPPIPDPAINAHPDSPAAFVPEDETTL